MCTFGMKSAINLHFYSLAITRLFQTSCTVPGEEFDGSFGQITFSLVSLCLFCSLFCRELRVCVCMCRCLHVHTCVWVCFSLRNTMFDSAYHTSGLPGCRFYVFCRHASKVFITLQLDGCFVFLYRHHSLQQCAWLWCVAVIMRAGVLHNRRPVAWSCALPKDQTGPRGEELPNLSTK